MFKNIKIYFAARERLKSCLETDTQKLFKIKQMKIFIVIQGVPLIVGE